MTATLRSPTPTAPHRGLELPALVAIAWSLAGGMLLGGVAVVAMIATDRLSGHLLLMASATLFPIGAALGLLHGIVLGVLGRPDGMTRRQALGAMLHGVLYYVPALLLGWLIASWVAAMPIALSGRHLLAVVFSALAWTVMALTVAVAGSSGARAAALAYRRWPDRVLGTVLVAGTLVALLTSFAIQSPVIWFTRVRLTGPGAVLLAFAATFWFYGPIITVGLWLLRKARPAFPRSPALPGPAWRAAAASALLALAAGLGVALLAVPFHAGTLGLPTDVERVGLLPAMALAVSDAVTDELLLRLFVFTVVFVAAIRYLPPQRRWAVWLAVIAATVADIVFHWPAVPPLGLPGAATVGAYVLARMAIPATVFGYLFWRRGLGTALAAHAAAGAAVGLLAL